MATELCCSRQDEAEAIKQYLQAEVPVETSGENLLKGLAMFWMKIKKILGQDDKDQDRKLCISKEGEA